MLAGIAFIVSIIIIDDPLPPTHAPPPGPPSPVTHHGKLGRKTVKSYIRRHLPAVRHCYVLELGRRPGLQTSVAVRFTITPNGDVSRCTSGPSAVERCVVKAVGKIKFPRVFDVLANGQSQLSTGDTAVNYRFRFRPAKRKKRAAAGNPVPMSARPLELPGRQGPILPAANAPASAPTSRPVGPPAPSPAAPAAGSSKPRIRLPASGDPLGGIDLTRKR